MSKRSIEEKEKWGISRASINQNTDELYAGAGSRTAGNIVAVVGDSISQHNVFAASNKLSKWARGYLNWAEFYSHGIFTCPNWWDDTVYENYLPNSVPGATRYFFGLNYGVSGNKSDDIAARINDVITLSKCDIAIVLMSTNDIDEISKEAVHEYTLTVCDTLLAAGIKVILFPIPMRGVTGTNSWAIGSDERKKSLWTNSKRAFYSQITRGLHFFDANKYIVNSATGEPFAGYLDDQLHFAPPCAEAVGKGLAELLATMLPPAQPRVRSQDDVYDSVLNPFGNILSNPFCLGTTGTVGANVTGTVCTGMRFEGSGLTTNNATAHCDKEATTDNRGDWQVITFTPGATETFFLFRTPSSDISHPFAAGDWVEASFEIETDSFNGFNGISLYVRDQGVGGLINYGMEPHSSGDYPFAARSRKGLVSTHAFQIVPGSSTIRYRGEIYIGSTNEGVTGTGVLKIRCLELRKVDDPKVAVGYTPA